MIDEQGSLDSNAMLSAGKLGNSHAKLPYNRPALTIYGSVKDLTRTGNGSGADFMGGSNLMAGGMGGGMGGGMSDPVLKENVVRIGDHPAGFGLYLFDFKPGFREALGHSRQFGVMADEVAQVVPEAVSIGSDGYRRVNYALLGITRH